jgi:hypothetical protein
MWTYIQYAWYGIFLRLGNAPCHRQGRDSCNGSILKHSRLAVLQPTGERQARFQPICANHIETTGQLHTVESIIHLGDDGGVGGQRSEDNGSNTEYTHTPFTDSNTPTEYGVLHRGSSKSSGQPPGQQEGGPS